MREPIDIGFTGAIIAALYRVLEQSEDAVAIIAIILGRINSALGRDGVRAARGIMIGKTMDVIALLAERGSSRRPRQPCAHYDD